MRTLLKLGVIGIRANQTLNQTESKEGQHKDPEINLSRSNRLQQIIKRELFICENLTKK